MRATSERVRAVRWRRYLLRLARYSVCLHTSPSSCNQLEEKEAREGGREGAGREGRVVCHARAPRAELAAALGRVDRAKFQLISRQGCTDGDTERGRGKLLHEGDATFTCLVVGRGDVRGKVLWKSGEIDARSERFA